MARLARGDAEDLARTPPGQIQVEARQRGLAPHCRRGLPPPLSGADRRATLVADAELGPRRNESCT